MLHCTCMVLALQTPKITCNEMCGVVVDVFVTIAVIVTQLAEDEPPARLVMATRVLFVTIEVEAAATAVTHLSLWQPLHRQLATLAMDDGGVSAEARILVSRLVCGSDRRHATQSVRPLAWTVYSRRSKEHTRLMATSKVRGFYSWTSILMGPCNRTVKSCTC